jgi:signal transduction histidine kinase
MKPKAKSLITEVVVNFAVLMASALVLISAVVLFVWSYQKEFQAFTPLIVIGYVLLFSAVVVGFGYVLLTRVLLRPLRQILEATERVAQGDFEVRVQAAEENELGALAHAFNRMTEQIKLQQQDLRQHLGALERVNRELERTQNQLIFSEKLASVGRLAAGVAHEIGNPLSATLGYLELLKRNPELAAEDRDVLQRIEKELDRIHRIIRELLDYSRPPKNEPEEIAVNQVLSNAVDLVSTQKGFPAIETVLQLDHGLPAVRGSGHELQQLLVNLILNAVDAMPQGGRLTISTAPHMVEPQGVEIRIADTGEGIVRENLRRIFDPFFTTREPGRGTGLGLSICSRIVESMDGRIEVESEVGRGSAFTVILPAAPSAHPG